MIKIHNNYYVIKIGGQRATKLCLTPGGVAIDRGRHKRAPGNVTSQSTGGTTGGTTGGPNGRPNPRSPVRPKAKRVRGTVPCTTCVLGAGRGGVVGVEYPSGGGGRITPQGGGGTRNTETNRPLYHGSTTWQQITKRTWGEETKQK